jgi:hypothetical protein
MNTNDIVTKLKYRAKELKEELTHIEGLLKVYGINQEVGQQTFEKSFYPERKPETKKSESLTSKAKKGIRELMEYPLSYQKEDIKYNLKKMGVADITKSTLHMALTALRDDGEVVGYRLNKSNQLVFYMSVSGKDISNERYPINEKYRPEDISENEIEKFEFLD